MRIKELNISSQPIFYFSSASSLAAEHFYPVKETSNVLGPIEAFVHLTQKRPFPQSLQGLEVVNAHLGGSTGAKLVKKGEQQWVQKSGSPLGGVGHLVAEYYTNKVYRAVGVPVPNVQLYDQCTLKPIFEVNAGVGDPVMLAEFIEGTRLQDYLANPQISQDNKDQVIKQLQAHFVLDCLLANWDVVGLDLDNIIVTKTGVPYRIDNGSGFEYRAQGEVKGSSWGDSVNELFTMRDPHYNPAAAFIYGNISNEEIVRQIQEIHLKRELLLAAVPEKYSQQIFNRLEFLEQIKPQLEKSREVSMTAEASRPNQICEEWDSPEGIARLQRSEAKANIWKLLRFYESQIRPTYCSVATSVITLNALSIEAPPSKFLGKYRLFTQEEFFSESVSAIIDKAEVDKRGMSLEELTNVLSSFPIGVLKCEAKTLAREEIKQSLISALKNPDQCVLALYQRKDLNQEGSGHWSPLAAYDAGSDSFLVLDVARFKYPPVWVDAETFIKSMQTQNLYGQSRGFIVITK